MFENLCESKTFSEVLEIMASLYPKLDSDLTVRADLEKVAILPYQPEPAMLALLFLDREEKFAKLTPNAISEQEKFLLLLRKINPKTFMESRSNRFWRTQTEEYEPLKKALQEKVKEDWADKHLNLSKDKKLFAIDDQPKRKRDEGNFAPARGNGKGKGKGKGNQQRVREVIDPSDPEGPPVWCYHHLQAL